jgi:Yip1 domain
MTIEQPSAGATNLVERAKNIILTPRAEWDRIAAEPANPGAILTGYWLPLAVLAVLAMVIGQGLFGIGAMFLHVSVSWTTAIVGGVVRLVFMVVGLYVGSFIVSMLAPNFASSKDFNDAFKLTAYSQTAALLAGLFAIYPPLGPLGILGLYAIVLFYLGLPRVMKTPEDKRVGYMATIVVVYIVLAIVFVVVGGAFGRFIPGMGAANPFGAAMHASNNDNAKISIGGVTIDAQQAERAAKQMEDAANKMSASANANGGDTGAGMQAQVDPAALQALLPASLPGGFAQSSISSSQAMGASQAEAEYVNGDAHIKVTVVHPGAMGAMMGLAAAAGVQSNQQTADGYTRTRTVNGRVYNEEMSVSAGTVSYTIIGHGGATISVEGSGGVSGDQATAVLNAIGVEKVEALGS